VGKFIRRSLKTDRLSIAKVKRDDMLSPTSDFADASEMINRIAANRWRLPEGVEPQTHKPMRQMPGGTTIGFRLACLGCCGADKSRIVRSNRGKETAVCLIPLAAVD